jgi:hypothetical protein
MRTLPIVMLLFLFSCKKDSITKEYLIGSWKLEIEKLEGEIAPPPSPFEIPEGVEFLQDSIENFNGYYDYKNDSLIYVGNFSSYKIRGNKLVFKRGIFTSEKAIWEIVKPTPDTLFLKNSDTNFFLKRIHLNPADGSAFDQIIYSTTACYGRCAIHNLSLSTSGELSYLGEDFVPNVGAFKTTLNKNEIKWIFNKFYQLNPLALKEKYIDSITDLSTTTISFAQKGKIIKTIEIYGYEETPDELIWAKIALEILRKKSKFEPMNDWNSSFQLEDYTFRKGNKVLNLEKSEMYFLLTELSKAKTSNSTAFQKDYQIEIHQNKDREKPILKSIQTDGRYYLMEWQNEPSITYDLGYNFIERNFSESDFK